MAGGAAAGRGGEKFWTHGWGGRLERGRKISDKSKRGGQNFRFDLSFMVD